MSRWTHIVAVIDVDTYKEDKNIKWYVESLLRDAPKITGSEKCAEVFVNVLSGHNVWIGGDCKVCEYKDTIVHHEDGFSCKADENYQCPEGEYQTRVVITVIGDLRDRTQEKTNKEYKSFLVYLEKDCDFDIRNQTVKIIE